MRKNFKKLTFFLGVEKERIRKKKGKERTMGSDKMGKKLQKKRTLFLCPCKETLEIQTEKTNLCRKKNR